MEKTVNALDQLARAVRVLAQPAVVQRQVYPAFVCVPDELALDVDDALRMLGPDWRPTLEQRAAVEALDKYMIDLAGETHAEFWEDDALDHDPRWDDVRRLARQVLDAFAWPPGPIESNGAIYVAGPHGGTVPPWPTS